MRQLHYLFSGAFPSRRANRLQTMKMCEAFGKQVCTTLYFSEAHTTFDDIRAYYNVKETFNLKILEICRWPFIKKSLSLVWEFTRYLKKNKAQGIIYTREILLAWWLLIGKQLGAYCLPVVVELHEWPAGGLFECIAKYVVCHAYKLVVLTASVKKRIESFAVQSPLIIHSGVDLKEFEPALSREQARKKLKLPLSAKIVCHSGHLYEGRGIKNLMDCAQELREVLFLFIGGTDEDVEKALQDARRIGADNVRFVGYVPHRKVALYLFASDVLVMPYTTKTRTAKFMSPVKMFEYMAAARPIVATDFPTIREVLQDGHNAILVEPDSARALLKGIQYVLENKNLAEKIAQQAYSDVKRYTWDEKAINVLGFIGIGPATGNKAVLPLVTSG